MPSIEAPTYYDHSKGIMLGRYDQFFRYLDADWWVEDTGDVEQPLGAVALIEVTEEMQLEYMEKQDISADLCHECRNKFGVPDLGWYVTRLDSNGIIFVMEYGSGTLAEEGARADFAEAEKVAAAWWRAEDQEYDDERS